MTDRPLITLSIVSHGDAERVNHLLSSIQECEPDTKRLQVILTDNLGSDLPEFDSEPWASLYILRNKKQYGLAYNNNRIFEIANGEYFAILNPDLIFEKAIFDQLITSLRKHHAHLVAPQIIDTNGNIQDSYRRLPSPVELIRRRIPGYHFEPLMPDANGLVHPDWIAGMFWLMPLDIYCTLHGMDEKFKLYFEDVDFCTRARLQGMKIVADTNQYVLHDAQRSSRKKLYYLFLHTWSAVRFFMSPVYRQAKLKIRDR